jgi:hypothetical protein
VAMPLSTSPPFIIDGVDKMYYQLVEIHTITTMQLAECAHRCWSDSTSSLVRAGTGRQKLIATPSMARLAPSCPTDFLSQTPLW